MNLYNLTIALFLFHSLTAFAKFSDELERNETGLKNVSYAMIYSQNKVFQKPYPGMPKPTDPLDLHLKNNCLTTSTGNWPESRAGFIYGDECAVQYSQAISGYTKPPAQYKETIRFILNPNINDSISDVTFIEKTTTVNKVTANNRWTETGESNFKITHKSFGEISAKETWESIGLQTGNETTYISSKKTQIFAIDGKLTTVEFETSGCSYFGCSLINLKINGEVQHDVSFWHGFLEHR
jgi:hypothetical protein